MLNGNQLDLLNPAVQEIVFGWLKSGAVIAIHLGTPCSSFSLARRGPAGSLWGPARSPEHLFGLPGLAPVDQRKVAIGNKLMRFTARVIDTCIHLGIPVSLENPHASRLFRMPPIRSLGGLESCVKYVFDQCSFGCNWRKRTAVWCWHASLPELFDRPLCQSQKGICSFSQNKHTILEGKAKGATTCMTAAAAAYPQQLAYVIARGLTNSYCALVHRKLISFAACQPL